MKAALYARVSTKDKDQQTENQKLQLREFCRTQGWTIVREYEDYESGGTAERIEFQTMMQDAMRRKFEVVVFWSLDRFSREGALATLQHLNTLSTHGIGYRSLTEPYLDSCGIFKDAIIAILGTVARQERMRISERVCAGLRRARLNGTRSGRPIGRPKLIFDRAKVVELRLEGLSWRQIARRLGISVASARRAYQSLETCRPRVCSEPTASTEKQATSGPSDCPKHSSNQ